MTFEKETLALAMKEKGVDIALDAQTRTALYLNGQGKYRKVQKGDNS